MVRITAVLLAGIGMSLPLVAAQYARLGIVAEDERVGNPANKPEPRKRIGDEPLRIFQKLISKSDADRRTAAQQLGWHTSELPSPVDARLLVLNLDSDDETEVIFLLSGSPASTIALVFDHDKTGWWQVGHFSYWWHWTANQAEKVIELREIVWYGRKDIMVRIEEGGTGVASTQLAIYRLHKGSLYKVFETVEQSYSYIYGGAKTVTETRHLEFPDEDTTKNKFIVVRYVKTTEPDVPTRENAVLRQKSCLPYRWDSHRFLFVPDRASVARLCGSTGPR